MTGRDQTVRGWEVYGDGGSRIGPAGAAVVVVEFGDYECPFCKRFDEVVHKLLRAYPQDVAFVYRHYPLTYHAHAYQAARWAECAREQGRFEDAHRLLFSIDDLGTVSAPSLATQLAVPDSASFERCATNTDPVARIEADRRAGERLGVRATPTVLVNDLRLAGTPDSARLFNAVRDALQRSRRGGSDPVVEPRVVRVHEDFRLDGHAGTLMPVGGGVLLADGGIALTQPIDRAIRIFNRRGSETVPVGRSGSGPGEFQAMSQVGFFNDTLWVYDGRLRRFTLFAQDGGEWRLARTHNGPHTVRTSEEPRASAVDQGPLSPRALLPTGEMLVSRHSPDEETLLVLDARLRLRNIVATLKPVESDSRYSYFHRFADGSVRGSIFPHAPLPRQRVSADGRLFAYVETSVDSPQGGQLEIRLLGVDGDTILQRRLPFSGEPIDRAEVDRDVAAVYERLLRPQGSVGPERSREAADAWRRNVVVPQAYPPLRDVWIGADSSLWLQLRESGSRVPLWRIRPGTPSIERFEVAAGSRLLAADDNVLWVAETDSLGVPSLVRYRRD